MTQPEQEDSKKSELHWIAKSFSAFVYFGVGQAISGILMGKLVDIYGSKKTVFLNVISLIVTIVVQYFSLETPEFDTYSYLSCLFWGISDGFVNTHCL